MIGSPLDFRADPRWIALSVIVVIAAGMGILAGLAPSQAIGVAGAVLFVPIIFTWYTFGVGVFVVSTFLGLSGTAQKGIGLLVVIAALQQMLDAPPNTPGFVRSHRGLAGLLLAYLVWCFAGLLWAGNPSDVIYSLTRYAPDFLVFVVIFVAARTRRDVLMITGFFVFGAAVAAASAILSPPPASVYGDVTRSAGIFGDPNELAATLVTGFTVSATLAFVRAGTIVGRVASAIACALCLFGILLSVSRGGLIALGVALLSGVVVAGRWRLLLGSVTVVLAVIAFSYFSILAPTGAEQRLTSSSDGGSGRTTIWAVGWREVEHNTVLGVGAGNFSDAGKRYVLEPGSISHLAASYTSYFIDTPTVAHNTYLEVLAEGGVVGLGVFLGILGLSLQAMYRAALAYRRSGDREMELLCYGILCGAVGFLAASFFLSQEYSKQLYIVIALGPGLLRAGRDGAAIQGVSAARRARNARIVLRRDPSTAVSTVT